MQNSLDPDQMHHSTSSEQGLHCLYISPKQVYSLKGMYTLLYL